MFKSAQNGEYYEINSPTKMPLASGFLWNNNMMIHMNVKGYAVAQFMQPEPAKYSHGPNIEAKTFMQPEQGYYENHPGRFFYIKDEETNEIFSVPFEPVKVKTDGFVFSVGKDEILWHIEHKDLLIDIRLSLPTEGCAELWEVSVKTLSIHKRKISIYPYFTIGYMSWMNQSGEFNEELQAIICSSVTPYQKYVDYYKIKEYKDKTYLIADRKPTSWEVNHNDFIGDSGLSLPMSLLGEELLKGDARYEMPVAVLQYRLDLNPGESELYRFVFGPAKDEKEIKHIRHSFFEELDSDGMNGFEREKINYPNYIKEGTACLKIQTPDEGLNDFVNHWLPRQMYYHGSTNRLSTDPQTRNYLQDNMGMSYIKPEIARHAFLLALSQQSKSGAMPDGVVLYKEAELKYINQVPHSDHCVWLPICLQAYLDETNDYDILNESIPFKDDNKVKTVFEHMNLAMNWLINNQDERGLNYINQGDWCDPMNMVGFKGIGVSSWLTIATSYGLKVWSNICDVSNNEEFKIQYQIKAEEIDKAINKYLWHDDWYCRGITDDQVVFGINSDPEGKIFLNPQGFALLSGVADEDKQNRIFNAVATHLETPYGLQMLAPAFTKMREDVGRVTQKYPGSAENGAVYNHAASFYIYGLYSVGQHNLAFQSLRKMITGLNQEDLVHRGQLPVFIPNYYRGAYSQYPDRAGRSSQLFNTGTTPWFFRCLIDGLFGLQGCKEGLKIHPQLPKDWEQAQVTRLFRGSEFDVLFKKVTGLMETKIRVNNVELQGNIITDIAIGNTYKVIVELPEL